MIAPQGLTPEERRAIGIAAATTLATGLVTWAIEELKERTKRPSEKGGAS